MTIFCVRDGDSSPAEGWNKPLEKVEKPKPPVPDYVPTETPGIVRNTKTGGLETNFPEPPALSRPSGIPEEWRSLEFTQLPQEIQTWVREGNLRNFDRNVNVLTLSTPEGQYQFRLDFKDNWEYRLL